MSPSPAQVPYYKGEHVAFDIVPPLVEFSVQQESVRIEEPFRVAGFSVYGKVVNKVGVSTGRSTRSG